MSPFNLKCIHIVRFHGCLGISITSWMWCKKVTLFKCSSQKNRKRGHTREKIKVHLKKVSVRTANKKTQKPHVSMAP